MGRRTKDNGMQLPPPDVPRGRARSPREMEDGSCSDLEDGERADLVQMGGGRCWQQRGSRLSYRGSRVQTNHRTLSNHASRLLIFLFRFCILLLPAVPGAFFCLGSVTQSRRPLPSAPEQDADPSELFAGPWSAPGPGLAAPPPLPSFVPVASDFMLCPGQLE